MKSERNKTKSLKWLADMKLTMTKCGNYYLSVPRILQKKSKKQTFQIGNSDNIGNRIVSLVPGSRTFLTSFDNFGNVIEWGTQAVQKLCRLQNCLFRLDAKMKQYRHKKRYKLRKARSRLDTRIKNLRNDFHRKACNWLCENYDVIFLPKFETSKMVKKSNRKIGKRTIQSLNLFSHYSFRQRLLSKSREYPNVKVFLVNEAFTSKTCTRCGWQPARGNSVCCLEPLSYYSVQNCKSV